MAKENAGIKKRDGTINRFLEETKHNEFIIRSTERFARL